ncbi:MAG: hypothetical protein WCM93_15855 [Bacteroidota bacterium]
MFKQMLEVVQSEINAINYIVQSTRNVDEVLFVKAADRVELLKVIQARMIEYEEKYCKSKENIQVNIKSLVGHVNIIITSGTVDTTDIEKQVTDALLKAIKAADQKS